MLPGVRFACDGYVTLCRESPLVVAVASSLTEMFAPDLMSERIAAWEKHYPVGRAPRRSATFARACRARGATARRRWRSWSRTRRRARCRRRASAALIRKTEILWHLADCVQAATAGAVRVIGPDTRVRLAGKARLRLDRALGQARCCFIPSAGWSCPTAPARIVALCGEATARSAAIVDELAAASTASRARASKPR